MSLDFNSSTSPLFTKLGRIIHAAKTLDTARETTVPAEIEDVADQYATGSLELQAIPDQLQPAVDAFRSAGDGTMITLRDTFTQTIIRYIKEDEQQPTDSLEDALRELIRQMEAWPVYVEYNAPTATATAGSANIGNGKLVVSALDRHGRPVSLAYAETITAECVSDTTEGEESWRFRGVPSVSKLAYNWPAGSGCDVSINSAGPNDRRNLIDNGSFEEADDDDSTLPDGWLKGNGTAAALVTLTSVEVQTVTISSTPSSGNYYLSIVLGGVTQRTDPLAWDASGATVQAALRALNGLEAVTVSTSGTSPDFTHSVTFHGVTSPPTMTVTDNLVSGSVATALVTGAAAEAYHEARAVKLTSNGSGSGSILFFRLTNLAPSTCYALGFVSHLTGASGGSLTVKLIAGVGGSTIADEQGTANSAAFAYSTMTAGHTMHTAFFRTPATLPDVVYLDINVDTAFTNLAVLHLDNVVLIPTIELYDGGPHVAVFSGSTPWALEDLYSIAVANAYEDQFQQWFNRFCDMDALDLRLPANGSVAGVGNELQSITITGTPTGGTFTLTYAGQTTAGIAFDASAATVDAALEALSNIGAGDVTCDDGPLPGSPVSVEFTGALAERGIAEMTANGASLTGGTTPTVHIATSIQGKSFIADSTFIV